MVGSSCKKFGGRDYNKVKSYNVQRRYMYLEGQAWARKYCIINMRTRRSCSNYTCVCQYLIFTSPRGASIASLCAFLAMTDIRSLVTANQSTAAATAGCSTTVAASGR